MANKQEVIKELADDNTVKNNENALLLKTLIFLDGDCFYRVFVENGITIESLQYMTSKHLQTICSSHDYDTINCFEKKLKKWQENIVYCKSYVQQCYDYRNKQNSSKYSNLA